PSPNRSPSARRPAAHQPGSGPFFSVASLAGPSDNGAGGAFVMGSLSTRRRWALVGSVLLLVALAAGVAVAAWVRAHRPPPVEPPPKETLLGLEIGNRDDDVLAALGPPEREARGYPWGPGTKESLGHVLKAADIGDDLAAQFNSDVRLWSKGRVCVVLRDGAVCAVVVRAPHAAASARGVEVGDAEARLEELYPEPADVQTYRPGWIKV